MKNIKLLLFGISLLLFGIAAILLAGLQGLPTFQNGVYELLGIFSSIVGIAVSFLGFIRKDN